MYYPFKVGDRVRRAHSSNPNIGVIVKTSLQPYHERPSGRTVMTQACVVEWRPACAAHYWCHDLYKLPQDPNAPD